MWARHRRDALFLGLKPWEIRRLTIDDREAAIRAEQQRHNRIVRLVAWAISKIPYAVGLGFSGGDQTTLRKFRSDELLKQAPDYDAKADEE